MHMDDRNFVENAEEFAMLDDDAKAAFTAGHAKYVSRRFSPPRGRGRGGGFSGPRGGICKWSPCLEKYNLK